MFQPHQNLRIRAYHGCGEVGSSSPLPWLLGPWEICECVQEERSSSSLGSRRRLALGKGPAWRSGPEVRARHPVDESTPQQLHKMFGYVNNHSHPLKQFTPTQTKKHTLMLMSKNLAHAKIYSMSRSSGSSQFWSFNEFHAWVLGQLGF